MAVPATVTAETFTSRNAVRIAWAVLLFSFGIFCLTCSLGTFGAYYFLFQSETGLSVRLIAARGGIDITYPDGSKNRIVADMINLDSTLETDDTSQGYLIFEDTYSKQMIAHVHLLPNTRITLRESARPRFDFSGNPNRIDIRGAQGHLFIDIPTDSQRNVTLAVNTDYGQAIFDTRGQFKADLMETEVRVIPVTGTAVLRPLTGESFTAVPDMLTTLVKETGAITARDLPYRKLNVGFGSRDDVDIKPSLPVGWGCNSEADKAEEIDGTHTRALLENKLVLLMERRGVDLGHAETFCVHPFNVGSIPLDISGYTSLNIQVRFKILNQDVTTCGNLGTECPVMLELVYTPADLPADDPTTTRVWRHGFYAIREAIETRPLICDTCPQEHEKITRDAWYIYDSGDLFSIFQSGNKPIKLQSVRVYSSGHAYEVAIADLSVVVGLP